MVEYLKQIIFSDDFKDRNRTSPRFFTRTRSLPFSTLILFLINLRKSSTRTELDNFFKTLNNSDIAKISVSPSAFSQARLKLKPGAFIELNSLQNRNFYNHADPKTWHGYNLIAFDGSKCKLPNKQAIAEHFGLMHPRNGGPIPMARISQMFDVLNKITLDAIIAPMKTGEHELASYHVLQLRPVDLVLMDRGYPAFWLFKMILTAGANFCARISYKKWTVVNKFYQSGQIDQIVTLSPSAVSKKTCRELGIGTEPLRLRLIRVELPSGETEILITSLTDSDAHPHHLFADLYHHRWPVEEDYKIMKSRLELENWSGESAHSVYQDFHAKVFIKNLAAVLVHPAQEIIAQKTAHRKHRYQVNFTQVLSKIKNSVVLLFNKPDLNRLLSDLIDVFVKIIEPVRPGRKYDRKKKSGGKRFYPAYKPIP